MDPRIAQEYVRYGQVMTKAKKFRTAFSMYITAFNRDPSLRNTYEVEFIDTLAKLNEGLTADKKEEIFDNFQTAMAIFPGHIGLLNQIGEYLYSYGFYPEALCHFEKALNLDHNHATTEKNLNNTKQVIYPMTLFRALNDKKRNMAFKEAIKQRIDYNDSVINIDSGTGVLALYAHECQPLSITACEISTPLAKIAENVIMNNLSQEIPILNKPSVILNSSDVGGYKSVLLIDKIDCGLFGENILQSLHNAWGNFLQSESKVIPGRAEFFIVGINCDELSKKYRLGQKIKELFGVANMKVHTTTQFAETYLSEDINLYSNVKYMTKPQSLLTIDFNNYEDVCEKLYREDPYKLELTAIEEGEINVIVGWFNLYLSDDIMLTTDPRSEDRVTAWDQAVFFDAVPTKVLCNQKVYIPFHSYGGRLGTIDDYDGAITRVSPETLAFLNDADYTKMIEKSVGAACLHLEQIVSIDKIDIVDMSPFPLFGILSLRRGANSLICHVKTIQDKEFLDKVLTANAIPASKFTILVSDHMSYEAFENKQFHVIFSHIFQGNGELDVKKQGLLKQIKSNNLVPDGIFLPSSVTMLAQLVSCNYLDTNYRLDDDNVGYRLANYVKPYQSTLASNLNIAQLKYKSLSEVFEVAVFDDEVKSDVIQVPLLEDGKINAILCWFEVQLLENWAEINTDRRNSFVRGLAFMPQDATRVFKDDIAKILRCIDANGAMKLELDIEP